MRFSIFSVADHYPEEPRTIRDLYTQLLDEIELADELGFSAFFLAEHQLRSPCCHSTIPLWPPKSMRCSIS